VREKILGRGLLKCILLEMVLTAITKENDTEDESLLGYQGDDGGSTHL
jgi:hypothetical protein